LAAYGWYARKPSAKRLTVVCGIFALALAAKPMAVTLPFVLLLLDYWPLRRLANWIAPSEKLPNTQRSVSQLLVEKIPLFFFAAAASTATVWAQSAGALRTTQAFPLFVRLENALCSYAAYIAQTFWPFRFGLFYPHPGSSLPIWKIALTTSILLAVSISAWMQRTIRPYLIVGWLIFLGVLFPMIGAVQVGDQAMADRYAYLSTIGLFIMTVFGAAEVLEKRRAPKRVCFGLVAIMIVFLCFLTARQISYWENSVSIWSHTLDVTSRNALAERKLGFALVSQGNSDEAVAHFLKAVSLNPGDVGSRLNLGAYYAAHDNLQDAMQEFRTAVDLTTDYKNLSIEDKEHRCSALIDLGFAYAIMKDYSQALADLRAADQTDSVLLERTEKAITRSLAKQPSGDAFLKLALLLRAEGRNEEAMSTLRKAVDANPAYSPTQELLQFFVSAHD
jgi:tetratricopeptide (TPR) repeat protein